MDAPHVYSVWSLDQITEISPWTGRFYSLLDPSYAKNNIPIIASVSEHQPTTWSSFYFDLQMLVFLFPGQKTSVIAMFSSSAVYFIIQQDVVRKHNKLRPCVAHHGIARFLRIDQKLNQVIPWSLRTFPENFMQIGPAVFSYSC